MNWLRRLVRWLTALRSRRHHATLNREQAIVRTRLQRLLQRLDTDLARFSQDMEDGWRRNKP